MAEVLEERLVAAGTASVQAVLAGDPSWLQAAAERAGKGSGVLEGALRADFGRPGAAVRLQKRVRIGTGPHQHSFGKTVVPITWESSGYAGLFPVMDGLIELHPAGRDKTRVVFWGRYDPPLGRTGDLVDRLLAHRVAEATVRGLLEALAGRCEAAEERVGRGA